MIDWIKFSERVPEREGDYLWFQKKDPEKSYTEEETRVLSWNRSNWRDYQSFDDEPPTFTDPDYWAEINLPVEKNRG